MTSCARSVVARVLKFVGNFLLSVINLMFRITELVAGILVKVLPPTFKFIGLAVDESLDWIDRTLSRRRNARVAAVARVIVLNSEFKIVAEEPGANSYLQETIKSESAHVDAELESVRSAYRLACGLAVLLWTTFVTESIYWSIRAIGWLRNRWPRMRGGVSARVAETTAHLSDRFGFGDSWVALFSLVGAASLALVIGIAITRQLSKFQRQIDSIIRRTLVPKIRVALNRYANENHPDQLLVSTAPGLGDSFSAGNSVTRNEEARVRALFEELGARAVAISGSRGVGKTALLGAVATPELTVAAPVTYNPIDFLVHLYVQVCEHALKEYKQIQSSGYRLVASTIRRISGVLVFAGVVCTWIPLVWPSVYRVLAVNGVPLTHSVIGRALFTAALVVTYVALARIFRPGFSGPKVRVMRRAAAHELRRLRFIQTTTSERSVTGGRWGINVGGRRSKQLSEKPTTLPELVSSYKAFVDGYASWIRASGIRSYVIIGIDELDRIAVPEEAERFVNDIKAVFGTRHCRYLVTVSEDALAGFERRVVRLRPALDSAFDEVLRLEIFSLEQSHELLSRRVAGFSLNFVALCHCISGGVPRDLLRAARALLEQRRSGVDSDIASLATGLVTNEIQTLKHGLLRRLVSLEGASKLNEILAHLADDMWPTCNVHAMLHNVAALNAAADSCEDDIVNRTCLDLAVAVHYYATIQELFASKEIRVKLRVREEGIVAAIDDLAAIRGLLPLSAQLAQKRLGQLRHRLRLTAIQHVRHESSLRGD